MRANESLERDTNAKKKLAVPAMELLNTDLEDHILNNISHYFHSWKVPFAMCCRTEKIRNNVAGEDLLEEGRLSRHTNRQFVIAWPGDTNGIHYTTQCRCQ
jgi:hypothetical protein